MPRNEDGEFELVLGNKQLLTVFFIIVILLGVFATMGYIVGRSSVPTPAVETAKKDDSSPPPLIVDPTKSPAAGASESKPPEPAPEPVRETRPQTAGQTPEKRTEPPQRAAKTETANPADQLLGPIYIEPSVGQTFLQAAALPKVDAELVAGIFRKRGIKAAITLAPPGKEGERKLYRVLVGPLKDAAEISKLRTDLDATGFPGSILRKY